LLPAATAILMALGFLRWLGEKQGLYGAGVGVVLMTLTACGVIAGLLWYFASWLDRDEATRRTMEAELRRSSRYFEVSRDLVCTAGFDGYFRQLNAAWTETLGWSLAELRSRPFAEFVHPDDREITERRRVGLAQGGVAVDFVNRYAIKDGGWRWLEWKSIADAEDGLIYASARDVTDRMAAEAALEASERQTRQILEAAHDAFVAIDASGDVTEWNGQAHATFGWSRAEVLGRELATMIIPERHRDAHRRGLLHFLGTGEGPVLDRLVELPAIHRDGHEFPVELTISAVVTTENGCSFNAFVRDISARKAEEEIRGRLAALVGSSGDAIIAKSLDGTIESWNAGAQELFGYAVEEAVGEPIAMLVPPEREDELAEILAQINRGERVEALETVRTAKDGRAIEVSLRVSPVYNAGGELIAASTICHDITRQKLLEAQLRRSSRYFDLSRDLTAAAGFDGYFKSVNPALEHILGWSEEQFLARPFIDMVHPDDRADTLAEVEKLGDGQVSVSFVNRCEAKDGSYRWVDWNAIVSPEEPLMYCSGRDITERTVMEQALREAEQRFRTAFDGAPIGVCLMSLGAGDPGRLLQANPALADILGVSVHDLSGVPVSSLTHPEDHADIYACLGELTDGRSSHVELEKRFMHRSGHAVWALISAAVLPAAAGQPAVAVTHVMDVSDRKQFEGQLQHLADHDALSGLFNRRRFSEEVERALKRAKRFGEDGAVLFLDLDGVKSVNDTLGHAAGDELIARVANLLASNLRETDTLARVRGDEFAVLLARCDQTSAVLVAEKLLTTLRRKGATFRDDRSARVSSSIGIALFGGDDELTADELVVEADIAMYEAKEAGKDRYAVYERTEGRRELMSIRRNWNERPRTAVEDDF